MTQKGSKSPGLLALSCLLWLILHGVALKKQQELREELELLRENSTENWAQAQRELLQAWLQQVELRRIIELLCQTIDDSQKCPDGWQFYKSSCYFFSEQTRSWVDAWTNCAAFEAHLVVVSTEEEQLFLMNNTQGNNTYWMGVTDEQHEGKWTWVTGKSPSFGFWDVWEEDPDKEHKDCGLMKPNGRWTNERCSKPSRWICEKSWDCNFSPLFPFVEEPEPDL